MPVRNRWTLAGLTSAGIFVTLVLRVNLSPVAPVLQRTLALSDFQIDLVLSAFLWVYTFLQPIAGLITEGSGQSSVCSWAALQPLVGALSATLLIRPRSQHWSQAMVNKTCRVPTELLRVITTMSDLPRL